MEFQRCRRFVALSVLWILAFLPRECAAKNPIDYNRDIRPILSDKCFFCHGPDAKHREADLRLDEEKSAKASVIEAGNALKSELHKRITSRDEFEVMPPPDSGKKLSAKQIALLKRWIDEGANYAPYWAYVPPRKHTVPQPKNSAWSNHWIDQFLMQRWEKEGITPSRDADPITLIRRLSFDLTGLPPDYKDVAKFAENPTPDAYEKLVDHYLASEHFGERMAVYWLDLVRYADTVGYHGDQDHNISPYRDYVIDAFNQNLPFDQFTKEQLAGDLLPNATIDQKIASGYNRLLQTSHEGGLQPAEYLAIYAADRVRNVSNVWMGATVGCAQCHDHKYDPYTAKDFYSLAAFFADLDESQHFKVGTNSLPTKRPPEIEVLSRRDRERVASLELEVQSLNVNSDSKKIEELKRQIQEIQKRTRKTMISVSIKPRTMRILPRGDWLDESGPVVEPMAPEFLGTIPSQKQLTRLDLASWFCDTEQGVGGLTARVMANRMWYLLFGAGISNSLDDFGGQGEPPVHPELLDQLAMELIEHDWNLKHLIKTILMSRAYRLSSEYREDLATIDPENRLYARQSQFRLPAEFIRDTALSISGLLDRTIGGPSVKPYQPLGYYRHLNFPPRKYSADKDSRQWRRGVYVHWQRQFLHPMLKAFDAPSREECTAKRPQSNTPLAALTLLNDPTFLEASRVFASLIIKDGGNTDDERLNYAFQRALSREPDSYELTILTKLLHKNQQHYKNHSQAVGAVTTIGQVEPPENPDAELAAWTQIARTILNLNETTTRN